MPSSEALRASLRAFARGPNGKVPLVGEGHTGEPRANHERLTVAQAAKALGITEGAVRSRIKRGTLRTAKEGGAVFVLLGGGTSQANQSPITDVPHDQSELVEELRRTNELLREVITTRDEEIRRRDTIIMNMTEAMKALNPPAQEAPSEAEESDVSSDPTSELGEVREELGAEQARREVAENTLREGIAEERRRREEAERERDDLRRQLYGLREARESPEPAEQQQGRGEPHSATGEAQEGARRPWWRRVFGG
jgi:hypothetical protein